MQPLSGSILPEEFEIVCIFIFLDSISFLHVLKIVPFFNISCAFEVILSCLKHTYYLISVKCQKTMSLQKTKKNDLRHLSRVCRENLNLQTLRIKLRIKSGLEDSRNFCHPGKNIFLYICMTSLLDIST